MKPLDEYARTTIRELNRLREELDKLPFGSLERVHKYREIAQLESELTPYFYAG